MKLKVGSYVGNWLVVSDRYKKDNGRLYYNDCVCVCGTKRSIQHSQLTHSLSKSCGCNNPTRFRGVVEGDLSLSYFNHCKMSAKKRQIPFDDGVDMKYLFELYQQQEGLCAYSKQPIVLNPRYGSQHKSKNINTEAVQTASLDRINSKEGYVIGNVQWVHKNINLMKNTMSGEDFILWCKRVSDNIKQLD